VENTDAGRTRIGVVPRTGRRAAAALGRRGPEPLHESRARRARIGYDRSRSAVPPQAGAPSPAGGTIAASGGGTMRFQRKHRAVALALPALGAALLASTAVHAQTPPAADASTATPAATPDIRIEVTGSNIKRVENEGALPVTVITRRDIERSGATSAVELLQQVSANSSLNAVTIGNSVGAVTFSAQTASLRGLGGGRTLVLINGHRLDSFAGELPSVQGVNLSAIPFQAIERVEILKDGASAIYGSDAIGGVINFITRSDYTGAEATAFYGTPTRGGGGDQWQASGSAGFGDLAKDGWNAFLSAQYNEQKSLDQVDRNFSNTSYRPDIGFFGISPNSNPGRIATGGIGVITNRGGPPRPALSPQDCAPSRFFSDDILGTDCFFDPAILRGVNMIPHEKTWNFFGNAQFRINADWQAYVTALYARDESHLVIQPGPVSSLFNYGPQSNIPAAITLQPSSPFYPHSLAAQAGVDGEPLDIWYRTFDNGFRDTTDTNENWEIVSGVKGSWRGLDWDGSLFYARGDTTQHVNNGFQDYTRLLPILNSGNVNFFGPNTPEVIALERSANFVGDAFHGTSTNYGGQVKTSGTLYELPAGSLAFAVGVEARKEEFEQTVDPALANGDITGYPGALKSTGLKDRKQMAAFGELDIPIVKTLEGDVAIRYDHYSDFGGTTNPKFGLRWQPTRTLLVRGSYGTGFLAPSLYNLFAPRFGGVTQAGTSDPIRCPVTGDTGVDCNTQFGVVFGGNANLKPEESEQTSVGVVIEPIPGGTFSVDWFKINLKNAIVNGISPAAILGDLAQFGSLVTRAPPDPNFPDLPGRITQIDQTFINLGALRIQGLDLEGRYRSPAQPWGRLSFSIAGTYYLRYDVQNTDLSYRGTVGTALGTVTTGVIPRWKHYASVSWDRGPWSLTLAQTYQTSYTDQNPDIEGNPRTVGSLSLWDMQGSYTGFRNWKLTLGVKNLFDRDPPLSNQLTSFIAGFDPSYYDPRARFVYASVTYRFK
jgi:iron complex outermembrane receptor protein